MEIPAHIRDLYRHWDGHMSLETMPLNFETNPQGVPDELLWFIKERISIWQKKISGEIPPYTDDNILQNYRFCNIFRELDRQTIEIHTWLNPIRDNFGLWLLNIFACRMIACPRTNQTLGYLTFDTEENSHWHDRLMALPSPKYGTPYVFPISTILKSNTPRRGLFLSEHLPRVIPEIQKEIKSFHHTSVYEGVLRILPLFKFHHSFLWTEVLIDVAYQFPEYINLFERFPIGPGALPTLKKIAPNTDPSWFVRDLAKNFIDTDLTIE